jgi:hypothetical protein
MAMLRDGRPTGVTVIAVLAAIGGIAPLAYGIISVIGSAATFLSTADSPALPVLMLGLGYLGIAAIYLGVAWALFGLKPWAWIAAAVVSGGHIAVNVLSALGGNLGWPQAILASIVPVIVFGYLFRSDVRTAFGR